MTIKKRKYEPESQSKIEPQIPSANYSLSDSEDNQARERGTESSTTDETNDEFIGNIPKLKKSKSLTNLNQVIKDLSQL